MNTRQYNVQKQTYQHNLWLAFSSLLLYFACVRKSTQVY